MVIGGRAENKGRARQPVWHRTVVWAVLGALLMWAAGCTGLGTGRLPSDYRAGYTERGMASWYGPKFHGRLTANGERYDQYAFTAAHRALPMGSVVRVTSLTNGRSVRVRINDRGPFVRGRIIDLSRAAAQYLGMVNKGVDDVEVRLEGYAGPEGVSGYLRVQVASFAERENARLLAARLRKQFPDVRIVEIWLDGGRRYRVQVGQFTSERQAESLARRIESEFDVEPLVLRDDT